MRKIGTKTMAMFAALLAGCGAQQVSDTPQSANPTATPAPTVTATPHQLPAGIYVAGISGLDSNDGTPAAPFRTVNAAIERAAASGLHDVWLFGGNEGSYPEVVSLADGVNLHGGVCQTPTAPMVIDTASCGTTISGGSPSLVAYSIGAVAMTVVENLSVVGQPPVQSGGNQTAQFFRVPGVGCVGRGAAPANLFPSCTPAPDAEGRPVPQSATAVVVDSSSALTFRSVNVTAADAANGLPGADGAAGANGPNGGSGTNAGSLPYESGSGGAAGVNSGCPDADGGAGGKGGRWYWDGVSYTKIYDGIGRFQLAPKEDFTQGFNGVDGADSFLQAAHGGGGALEVSDQLGFNGGSGAAGGSGANGAVGFPAQSNDVDPTILVATPGGAGVTGFSGVGGAGGGGGAPASIEVFHSDSSTSSNVFAGLGGSFSTTGSISHDVGEAAGGGGGAGAAGGCGGAGAQGGQGGAASVAMMVVNSTGIHIQKSVLTSGNGGAGGNGGHGGVGGHGGLGGSGLNGFNTEATAGSGSFTRTVSVSGGIAGFTWTLFSSTYSGSNVTTVSASQGGTGGNGGDGGAGGVGGDGAGGTGGASIGLLLRGPMTAADSSSSIINVGNAGFGGGPADAHGLDGIAAATHSL